jgi:predicted RNase H-like HicB family nuclease
MELKEYAVIIRKAGNNFAASSPDVPGCIATGPTVEATKEKFRTALEFHLEGLKADGTPIPEPSAVVGYVPVAA